MPLLLAAEHGRPAANFRMFFLFSFFSYLIILYWIPRVMVRYGGTTWLLGVIGLACLAAFLSLLSGLAGVLIAESAISGAGAAVFWIPAIWIARDLIIEKIFGGFPWCLVGYSQYKNIFFIQWAEFGGIHLVSFLVITVNVLLFQWFKTRGKKALAALLALGAVIYAGGYWRLKDHGERTAAVAKHTAGIIQPNSNHDQPFDFPRIQATLDELFRASRELGEKGAEFVVWPEFTVPIYPLQTPFFKRQFIDFSVRHVPLLAGFTDYGDSGKAFNSVLLFQDGRTEKYDKVRLTPFGEYVPFRRWLFFVKKITDEIGDFSPGEAPRTLGLSGQRLATPICYEIIYPELVRSLVAGGAGTIVTLSNDSWFGRSSAPYQHLSMSVLRSVENRRFLLRSTSNGISALIDPSGRILKQSPLHREDHFLAEFQYLSGRTVFTRWGYLFPYACLLLVLARSAWLGIRKRGRRYQS